MQQRLLGSAKTPISAIGLGCMGMSEFYGATDDAQSHSTMARALDLSVNFFDSADIYGFGHNETLIGEFLKAGGTARRAQVVLATKFGIVRAAGQYVLDLLTSETGKSRETEVEDRLRLDLREPEVAHQTRAGCIRVV